MKKHLIIFAVGIIIMFSSIPAYNMASEVVATGVVSLGFVFFIYGGAKYLAYDNSRVPLNRAERRSKRKPDFGSPNKQPGGRELKKSYHPGAYKRRPFTG